MKFAASYFSLGPLGSCPATRVEEGFSPVRPPERDHERIPKVTSKRGPERNVDRHSLRVREFTSAHGSRDAQPESSGDVVLQRGVEIQLRSRRNQRRTAGNRAGADRGHVAGTTVGASSVGKCCDRQPIQENRKNRDSA